MFFLLLFSGDGDSGAVGKVDVEVTEDTVAADKVDPTLKQVHQCSVHDVGISGSVYIRKNDPFFGFLQHTGQRTRTVHNQYIVYLILLFQLPLQ